MPDSFKSDFRGLSQDAKRAATHKAKWAYGVDTSSEPLAPRSRGRDTDHPRPIRTSDFVTGRSERARVDLTKKTTNAKRDHGGQSINSIVRKLPSLRSDESASSADEDHDVPMLEKSEILGGDGGPTNGSQVLSSALARAIEEFEDKETVKLVKTEWSVLDDDGEELGLSPLKKSKGKKYTEDCMVDEDDYELV